jgi:heat shock protein HtpX
VVLTRSLRELLSPEELEAVLAHELAHIANRDAFVMTVATVPGAVGAELTYSQGYGGYVWFFLWPIGALLLGWSTLLTGALSRYRELVADRGSALLTGTPERLMSALQKLSAGISRIPSEDLRLAPGFEALFIVPTRRRRFALFADHPPLAHRLDALSRLARDMGKPVR